MLLASFRSGWAAGALLCTYVIQQWAQSQATFFAQHYQITHYVTTTIMLYALACKVCRAEQPFARYPRVGWAVAGLLLYSLLSIVWSIYRPASIEMWGDRLTYLVVFVALAPLLITSVADVRDMCMSVLIVGTACLALVWLQADWVGRGLRLSTAVYVQGRRVDQSNALAIAELGGFVVIIGLLLNFQGISRPWQVMRWIAVIIGFAMSIRSGSRGPTIAALTLGIAFLPMSRRLRSIKGFFATSFGLILLVCVAWLAYDMFGGGQRWEAGFMLKDYAGGRLTPAGILLEHWLSANPVRWLIGLGSSASFDPRIVGFYPHMVVAEVLGELGIVGELIFLSIFWLSFRSVQRLYALFRDDPAQRGVLACISALVCYQALLSCKAGSLLGSATLLAFPIMLGRLDASIFGRPAAPQLPLEDLQWNTSVYSDQPMA
jgi:hypothetical protein